MCNEPNPLDYGCPVAFAQARSAYLRCLFELEVSKVTEACTGDAALIEWPGCPDA